MAVSREEMLMQSIATGSPSNVVPVTREEKYLSFIAGESANKPATPITRKEVFLDKISPSGGSSGGGGGSTGGVNKLAQMVDGTITEVTAVDLSGVTKIQKFAFYYRNSLANVVLPSSVTDIENSAFQNSGLQSMKINEGCSTIGNNAFYNCLMLKIPSFPSTLTSIGNSCFYDCDYLEHALLENTKIKTIGTEAFRGSGVTIVTLPNTLLQISTDCFRLCYSLQSVVIGTGCYNISSGAFYGCKALETVTVKSLNRPSIQTSTFQNCTALKQIIVPIGRGDEYKAATNWSNYADIIVEGDI